MVEQRSPKPTVEGSSPSAPAMKPLSGVFSFLGLAKNTRFPSLKTFAVFLLICAASLGSSKPFSDIILFYWDLSCVFGSLIRIFWASGSVFGGSWLQQGWFLAPARNYCLYFTFRLLVNRY